MSLCDYELRRGKTTSKISHKMLSYTVVLALLCVAATASIGFSNCLNVFASGFIPDEPSGAKQICRDGKIAISYDVPMIDPAWSAYFITYDEASSEIPGRLSFYEDPDLQSLGVTQASVDSDAFNNSWNRGHLAPSHILSHTMDSKKATYTMANIAPQEGTFNQQTWNHFETDVFDWIVANKKSLYIVTGVAYHSRSSPRRTYDNIAVPDYYWKVICDLDGGRSAGFYGHNDHDGIIDTFYSVKDVEAIYGGALLPSACNTDTVNPTHWWSF